MRKFLRKNKYILIALIALTVYMGYILVRQEAKYRELVAERDAYNAQIETLRETIGQLSEQIEEISTPEYIEKMAREKLQMVKPDEIIYILEDQND